MDYLEDLDRIIEIAEEEIGRLEDAYKNKFYTSVDLIRNRLDGLIKSARFCINCAKRKAHKLGIPECEFKCPGGCVKPGIIEDFEKINKRYNYVNSKLVYPKLLWLGRAAKESEAIDEEIQPK